MENKNPPVFNFGIPDSVKEMEEEMRAEDKKAEEANLEQIKDRNSKARIIIQRFSQPIECELDDIIFMLKPISVGSWDLAEGKKDEPLFQSMIVRDSLISPDLSDEEFKLLPAGLKYKLFMILLQDFFSTAGKVKRKK